MRLEEVNRRLMLLADGKNAKRSGSITPNARPILGARIPELRKLAKEISKEDFRGFLDRCPDDYMEQQLLQAFVIGYAKADIEEVLQYADRFIPKVGDCCVNDSFCQGFAAAKRNRSRVWEWLMGYAKWQKEYAQRVVAVMLMSHFLVDEYIDPVLEAMNQLNFDGYYTKMGVAWCVATAYAKYPQKTHEFLLHNRLADWTYNKAIQKMIESFRVKEQDKEMLRMLKR